MHIVAPGELGTGFLAFGETPQKIAALLRGQFRFAAEVDAAPFCPLASLAGAGAHQLALEFGEAPHTVSINLPYSVVVSADVSPGSGTRLSCR